MIHTLQRSIFCGQYSEHNVFSEVVKRTHDVSPQAHEHRRHFILVKAPAVLLAHLDLGHAFVRSLCRAARSAILRLRAKCWPEALVHNHADLLAAQTLDNPSGHTNVTPCTLSPSSFTAVS